MRPFSVFTAILLLMTSASFSQQLKEKIAPGQNMAHVTTLAPKPVVSSASKNVGPTKFDTARATLLDGFVTLYTDMDNKDPDTHWSFGLFDQSGNPIASFHDDSNTDEYKRGTMSPMLKMHMDHATTFGAFTNEGRIHINVAPNGNDSWQIAWFSLTLDFLNPQITQTLQWGGFTMSQDRRDYDLYFRYDGSKFVIRQ